MFYKIMRLIAYPFIRFFIRVEVTGKENIPKNKGYILCANHISMADVFALAIPFNCHIRYMAKGELFKFPPLKWLMCALGCVSVQRGKGDTEAIEKSCEILKKGGVFGIFPEGTRSRGGNIGNAKAGAAMIAIKTEADILPVSIRYSTGNYKIFCKTKINIGRLIPYVPPETEETQRGHIRKISNCMMDSIKELWKI